MRITFVGPVAPIRSGISQHGTHLTEALSRKHEVTVLSWHHQYPRLLFRRPQRDDRARPHPTARFQLRWWDPISWWRAGRVAARSDLLVLAWTTPFHALPYRVIMAAARGPRIVGIVHNAIPHETLPLQRPLTRWILSRCDRLVVHAQSVADELSEYAQSVETVVVPMPPLVDVEPRPLPPTDVLRLLFFGFVRPYKGLDLGLDALALLGDRGTRHRLTVVGEFWDREPVDVWHRRVAERGLQAQVELRPAYVSDSEVSALFAHHHAVLLPYRSATQSGIAPIALAAGRPVIATAVGGLIDVIIEGVNGTLAERDDVTSLADAIQRCERQLATLSAGALDNAPTWAEVAVAVAAPARLAAE